MLLSKLNPGTAVPDPFRSRLGQRSFLRRRLGARHGFFQGRIGHRNFCAESARQTDGPRQAACWVASIQVFTACVAASGNRRVALRARFKSSTTVCAALSCRAWQLPSHSTCKKPNRPVDTPAA